MAVRNFPFSTVVYCIAIVLSGCGGLSQKDMMKYAIKRTDDVDEPPSKPEPIANTEPEATAEKPDAGKKAVAKAVQNSPSSELHEPSRKLPTQKPEADNIEMADANRDFSPSLEEPEAASPPLTEAERRQRTVENMTSIAEALESYVEQHNGYPPPAIVGDTVVVTGR